MAQTTTLRVPVLREHNGSHRIKLGGAYAGRAVLAGALAALGMGCYLMGSWGLLGLGAWRPLNGIAASFAAFQPPAEGFRTAAALCGLGLHVLVGIAWALLYALAFASLPRRLARWGSATALGLVWGLVCWLLMGELVGPTISRAVAEPPILHFALAHLLYGLLLAWALCWLLRGGHREQSRSDPRP